MTITATRLANEHSGAASAQTDTYEGLAYVEGRQYLIIWHLLQNAAGAWDPEATVAVSDNDDDSWSLVGSSTGTTAYTAGGTNGTTLIAHLTAPITADNGDVDVLTDFNDLTTRQYIRAGAIYELSSDVGEISVAQVVGQVNSTGSMSLDWPTAPTGQLIVSWGIIHNSVATFATEPAGLTADDTNAASVCAYEIQTGATSADPLTTTLATSAADFDFHGLAIELTDDAGGGVTGVIAATAPPATATATGEVVASGTATATAGPATATSTGTVFVAAAGAATAPPGTLAAAGSTTTSGTLSATAPAAQVASTGEAVAAATGAATAPPATAAATGTVTVTATGAATAPAGVLDATGTVASDASTGAIAATAPAGIAASAGTVTTAGTAGASAPPATTTSTGLVAITGTIAATAPAGRLAGTTAESTPGPARFSARARPTVGLTSRAMAAAGLTARAAPTAGLRSTATEEVTFDA